MFYKVPTEGSFRCIFRKIEVTAIAKVLNTQLNIQFRRMILSTVIDPNNQTFKLTG